MTDHTKDTREAIARAIKFALSAYTSDNSKLMDCDLDDAATDILADLKREGFTISHLTALESAPPAGGDVRELLKEALDALELFIPSPMCRDCADENGTCPNSRSEARPCDPHEGAEWARDVRDRASAALTTTPAQPTVELAHADKLERVAAQLSAERFQGWANPLVADIMDAVRYLRKEAPEPDTGEAVLSAQRAPSGEVDGLVAEIGPISRSIQEIEAEVWSAIRAGLTMGHTDMRKAVDAKRYEIASAHEDELARKLADRVMRQIDGQLRTALGGGWRPLTGQAIERLGDTGQPFFASITVTNRQTGATHVETPYLYLAERETEEGAIYYEAAVVGTDDETGWDIDDYEYYMPFDLPPPPQLEGET